MSLQIPKKVEDEVKHASNELKVSEQEFLDRAIHFYLQSLRNQRKLEQEFAAWDKLSDEALINFEESL